MSQYARSNPDKPELQRGGKQQTLREVFGGGMFAAQAACFRAAEAAQKLKSQKDYEPGSSEDPAHGGFGSDPYASRR